MDIEVTPEILARIVAEIKALSPEELRARLDRHRRRTMTLIDKEDEAFICPSYSAQITATAVPQIPRGVTYSIESEQQRRHNTRFRKLSKEIAYNSGPMYQLESTLNYMYGPELAEDIVLDRFGGL